MDPNYDENPHSLKTYILEFIQTLAVCLVIGLIIYWQVAQPHKVQGSSMFPNFHNGDFILTNKIVYRFYPPNRGDIIVLQNPKAPANNAEDFIKRIIALPGERIKIQDGKVYTNGQILQESYLDPNLKTPPGSFLQEGVEVLIEPDTYIAIGDNRGASSDSREWGGVPKEKIIGKVLFRYWPKESFGLIPQEVKY